VLDSALRDGEDKVMLGYQPARVSERRRLGAPNRESLSLVQAKRLLRRLGDAEMNLANSRKATGVGDSCRQKGTADTPASMHRLNVHAPKVSLVLGFARGIAIDTDGADELGGEGSEDRVLTGLADPGAQERRIERPIILGGRGEGERLSLERFAPQGEKGFRVPPLSGAWCGTRG